MHLIFTGELSERLVFFERFKYRLEFELGTAVLTFLRHPLLDSIDMIL